MFHKTIIQGRLEFSTRKSFDKVIKMFDYRAENYHKYEMIFTEEEIFFEDTLLLDIPRFVGQSSEKHFKNTVSLIAYCSQFAISGSVRAWLIKEGKVQYYEMMEPKSDKAAVQSFLRGRDLVKQIGKEQEAIVLLNRAIEKYDRHAMAYERRAKVNFYLKDYHNALRDYNKCIDIDATIPTAYYGKAKIAIIQEEWEEAIKNFDVTLKHTVALQPIYWKARRQKAICHIELKQWEKAAFDLKLFTKRAFTEDNPNFIWRKQAFFNYGKVLLAMEDYDEALVTLDSAVELIGNKSVIEAELLRTRGVAKKLTGKNGYIKDLKDAADMGDSIAVTMLKDISASKTKPTTKRKTKAKPKAKAKVKN